MDTMKRFSWTLKRIHRVGPILSLVLVWQAYHSPLLGQFGSNVQYFSQVGVNGGSTTSFTINNPSDTETITVDAQLYFPDGTPLTSGQVELGPGATDSLTFGNPEEALTSGWAELKSEGPFIATEFFQISLGSDLKPRVGVLPSVASQEIRFLGFVNPEFTSGLAVSNPSPTEATEITLRARDQNGQPPVEDKTFMLLPLHSEAGYLNEEKFLGSALNNYEGVVEISVNSPSVAAVSLIQEAGTGDIATVSVLTESHIITTETNTALGMGALVANTTGVGNTATGNNALGFNTTGSGNSAFGTDTLAYNTSGSENTATGNSALFSNTEGTQNTANGVDALFSNTTGERNTANGVAALLSNTEGSSNTASGFHALFANTTGNSNTASGDSALGSNTTGERNTASGDSALGSNTTGEWNTASGNQALASNTFGSRNTATGNEALFSNTVGAFNTANGVFALYNNTTGGYNTASGVFGLFANTTGERNTASGVFALSSNTEGMFNTASGDGALGSNTEGSFNTASGGGALGSNTTGSSNIALGFWAGVNLTAGDNNIYIGNPGVAAESDTIRIGTSGVHTSAFIAGVQVVAPSARRYKRDIQDMDEESSDLMRLRPVTFRYKKEFESGASRRQFGLIAEEVAGVYPELVVSDETGQVGTVEYQKLPAMLLNELQKQNRIVQQQRAAIAELSQRLSRLEQLLTLQETPAGSSGH